MNWKNINISFGRVKPDEVAALAKNFSMMLSSGMAMSEIMETLSVQAGPKLKKIIRQVRAQINSGNRMSSALSGFPAVFGRQFIAAAEIGEASGTLEENLRELAFHLEKRNRLKEKIKSAMLYPAIILVLSFSLGLTLSFVVLPRIAPLFKGLEVELPASTRLLLYVSALVEAHGSLILAALCSGSALLYWLWRRPFAAPFVHRLYLSLPLIKGMARDKNLAEMMQVMGTMVKSGVNYDRAVEIAAETGGNYHYRRILTAAAKYIHQGEKLSDILAQHPSFFPIMAVNMIRVGERSGRLEEEFFNLAEHYSELVDNSAKRLSVVVEPVLLVVIGLAVGWLALSIITPIYMITGNVY